MIVVLSFFSAGGLTTVVWFSAGGTFTRVSHPMNDNAATTAKTEHFIDKVRRQNPGPRDFATHGWEETCASTEASSRTPKIRIITIGLSRDLSEIKLKRTDTTLDLSQKAKRAPGPALSAQGNGCRIRLPGSVLVVLDSARFSLSFFSSAHSVPINPPLAWFWSPIRPGIT
jgi:hypothetical protein